MCLLVDEGDRTNLLRQTVSALIHVSRQHHRICESRIDSIKLHKGQHMLLGYLLESEQPQSQKDIADHFDVSPACVARSLKTLAAEAYIERFGDAEDSRRNIVLLTEKGAAMVRETRRQFDALDAEMFSEMDNQQIETLRNALECLRATLTKMEEKTKGSASV